MFNNELALKQPNKPIGENMIFDRTFQESLLVEAILIALADVEACEDKSECFKKRWGTTAHNILSALYLDFSLAIKKAEEANEDIPNEKFCTVDEIAYLVYKYFNDEYMMKRNNKYTAMATLLKLDYVVKKEGAHPHLYCITDKGIRCAKCILKTRKSTINC